MQSWSIIIFCYNEKGNVSNVIRDCVSLIKAFGATNREIIIVDDGSGDSSINEIENEILKYPAETFKLIKHPTNLGIGMALKSGYSSAVYENVCAVPADGQFNVKELQPYSLIPENSFVCFYRKENQSYSLLRNILSLFNKKFNKWLLGIEFKDINWVKIYKTSALQQLDLKLNSSLVETEICAKLVADKNTFIEVQSHYLPRKNGVSKGASWNIVKKAMAEMLKVYIAVSQYKKKSRKSLQH